MLTSSANLDMVTEYDMDNTVSTVNTVSIDAETKLVDDFNPWDLFDYLNPAPFEYVVVTVLLLQFTCVFLNVIIVMYYRKTSEATRPYILTLVAFDLIIVIFALSSFAVIISNQANTYINLYAFKMFTITFNFGFGLYLYPSFYLALDRFIIVTLPLNFRDYLTMLRVLKFFMFAIHFMDLAILSAAQVTYGQDNVAFLLGSMLAIVLFAFVFLTTSFMYAVMVFQIIRSSSNMTNSTTAGNKNKSEPSIICFKHCMMIIYILVNLFCLFRNLIAKQNKRHVKSVKIGMSLFFLTIATYLPFHISVLTNIPYSGYLYGLIYINNFANFFVYFWIDRKFRRWVLHRV